MPVFIRNPRRPARQSYSRRLFSVPSSSAARAGRRAIDDGALRLAAISNPAADHWKTRCPLDREAVAEGWISRFGAASPSSSPTWRVGFPPSRLPS